MYEDNFYAHLEYTVNQFQIHLSAIKDQLIFKGTAIVISFNDNLFNTT